MTSAQQTPMSGKTILITGATDGIGKQTALELMRLGARVAVHARSRERGEPALAELRAAAPQGQAELVVADLASLAQVRALAEDTLARFDRLDALINNAGVSFQRRQETADGFEMDFGVNHLAHFLLTNLLLDRLRASAPARVVTVSSTTHQSASLHLDDPNLTHGWSFYEAYSWSKLANILFAYGLARRVSPAEITSNALHPGVVNTKMLREHFGGGGTDVAQGAATSLYLASSPAVANVTGEYFVNSRPTRSSPITYDEAAQERLWDLSARLVGL